MDWKDKYVVLKSFDSNYIYLEKDLIEIHPDATFICNTVLAHQLNRPWKEANDGTSSIDVDLSVLIQLLYFLSGRSSSASLHTAFEDRVGGV